MAHRAPVNTSVYSALSKRGHRSACVTLRFSVSALKAARRLARSLLTATQAARLTGVCFQGPVAIRPESILICRVGEGIPAQIVDYSLPGNVIRYRVVAEETELSVDVLNLTIDDQMGAGEQVSLQFEMAALREVD